MYSNRETDITHVTTRARALALSVAFRKGKSAADDEEARALVARGRF